MQKGSANKTDPFFSILGLPVRPCRKIRRRSCSPASAAADPAPEENQKTLSACDLQTEPEEKKSRNNPYKITSGIVYGKSMCSYSPAHNRSLNQTRLPHSFLNHTTGYSGRYSRTTNDNDTKPTYQTLLFDRCFIICGKDKVGQSAARESHTGFSRLIAQKFYGRVQSATTRTKTACNFNPRFPYGKRRTFMFLRDRIIISIHTPCKGSDGLSSRAESCPYHFNPRSPHGERHPKFNKELPAN